MPPAIRLEECLWIRSHNVEHQSLFRPQMRSLERRSVKVWKLDISSRVEMSRLREHLWKSGQHVILHGLLVKELNAIRPIFARRKNFSIMPIDWWLCPFWFSQNATYNIYHNYCGIAVRTGQSAFLPGDRPPWLMIPGRANSYEIQSALLRPAALAVSPLVDLFKMWQRSQANSDPRRFLYYPFSIEAGDVPLQLEPPKYDFTNLGATIGPWLMRDPFAPAWLNFANLYADRRRLMDLIMHFDQHPFTVYDRRRNNVMLPWQEMTRIIRQSRFIICSGGLQGNSVAKFLETACLGIPMLGTGLRFEFPWLSRCMVEVNPMRMSAAELKPILVDALERHPTLRQNCLETREILLRLYHPDTLFDMLQGQINGQAIPPGYLTGRAAKNPP